MADVRAVPVKAGDRVRAGQTLVLLDGRELQAHRTRASASQTAVTQSTALAEADRQAAEAGLALARLTHQRMADLKAKNSATQGELDEAVATLRGAEARMSVAEARVAEARASIASATAGASAADVAASYATLTAPFDGVVTEKSVDPGNMASPGQPLVTVEDDRSFRLEVRLDESRAAFVHVGDEVRVRLDGAAADAAGRVAEVERVVDPGSHDFLVKVDLAPATPLRSGMYGRAAFRGAARQGLAVPEAAVVRRGQLVQRVRRRCRQPCPPPAGECLGAGRRPCRDPRRAAKRRARGAVAAAGAGGWLAGDRRACGPGERPMTRPYGVAGRLAAAFIDSKLTPLFLVASLALGALAVVALPREEEPQIIVPMIDVIVQMPGASPAEVEQRVTRPMEKLLWEIPGVEYVYSTSSPGLSMVIVRFYVGQNEEQAIVRLNQKLFANMDIIPPGVSAPIVKPRSIDDVPVMALTLWGERYADVELRRVAEQLHDVIKEVPDVSEVTIAGGRRRQITVEIDPARLASYGIDPLGVQRAIQAANMRQRAGEVVSGGRSEIVEAGAWIDSVARLENVVVDARGGRSVWLRDVAAVRDEDGEPTSYVAHHTPGGRTFPAVTISIAKRKGVNAIDLTRRISAKLDTVRGVLVPSDLEITVTRNYGETAAHKSNELLWHMFLAVVSVGILIWLTLGRREAAVVLVAIPVTLALTLFVFYLYGYTLNRITLFALIFSIGILVDDAIVVVENIVRHARLATGEEGAFSALIVKAVDEVGNPTILATLTVIAAILPMAFVGGLMGPYMRPIPVGATAAMVFSLVVAFVVTPWAAKRLLTKPTHHDHGQEDRLTVLYRRGMGRLIVSPTMRAALSRGGGRAAPGGRGAGPAQARHGEDAAVRQQERVPGHRRHARGHAARRHGAGHREAGAGDAPHPVGDQRPELRRRGVALQLQRPRAPLLPAPRAAPGGSAGEPAAEGGAVRAEPRHRQAGAGGARADRHGSRRADPGGGSAAGPAGAADARRRGVRSRCRRGASRSPGRSRTSSAARPAWSTWTGTSRRRSPRSSSTWTRRRPRRPV